MLLGTLVKESVVATLISVSVATFVSVIISRGSYHNIGVALGAKLEWL